MKADRSRQLGGHVLGPHLAPGAQPPPGVQLPLPPLPDSEEEARKEARSLLEAAAAEVAEAVPDEAAVSSCARPALMPARLSGYGLRTCGRADGRVGEE